MPYSTSLMVTAVAGSFLLVLVTAALSAEAVPQMALRYLVSAAFFAGSVMLLLYLNRLQSRVVQTLTAVFGASVVFSLIDLFVLLAGGLGLSDSLRIVVLLMMLVWSLVVDGFILSVAINSSLLIGCMLALIIFIPQLSLIALVSPAQP